MTDRVALEQATGTLFGDLWGPYNTKLFEESVELFFRRLDLAGLPRERFRGARCLDAGCGGGRNSIAMARLGASRVTGIDLGVQGLEDARRRAADLSNVEFQHASILDIPFPDATFDVVWCAGVLMITADEERALDELTRVVKPGGNLYLLVYATEGLRWPLIEWLRPFAAQITQPVIERALEAAGLAANKRRTFLDDLFCPKLDFYDWPRLQRMLERRGSRRSSDGPIPCASTTSRICGVPGGSRFAPGAVCRRRRQGLRRRAAALPARRAGHLRNSGRGPLVRSRSRRRPGDTPGRDDARRRPGTPSRLGDEALTPIQVVSKPARSGKGMPPRFETVLDF